MSTLAATLLVIGLLLGIGGPLLWWVFFRMDEGAPAMPVEPLPRGPLSEEEIAGIESELGLKLPGAYHEYLAKERTDEIDGETVFADPELIVSWTQTYREGYCGMLAWPQPWIYIGDEADACPYVLDTKSGEVLRLDKGNRKREPLARYANFGEFIATQREGAQPARE